MKTYTYPAAIMSLFLIVPTVSFASQIFNTSLSFGMRGNADVSRLQQFLIDNSYLSNSTATGNYLTLTQQAVRAFQVAHNLPTTGYFGPMTRAVVNGLLSDAGANTSQPQISSLQIHKTSSLAAAVGLSNAYTINWKTTNYPAGAGVDLNLIRKVSDSPKSYLLVRQIAKDTTNDGTDTWIPQVGETGNDLYIQVTCSSTFVFKQGCSIGAEPTKAF